jgi:hypothetical protein
MSQFDFGVIDPYVVDGVQLADDLNQWRDAVHSQHRGGVRPAYVVPGMDWINDAGGPTNWILNFYVSATIADKPLFNINTTTGAITLGAAMQAVTQPAADNSQLLATTAMVQAAIAAAIASALASAIPTGTVFDLLGNLTVAPAGWVLAMQGTIGNAASGATIRANADCANLFAHLWTLSNTYAPVLPAGRGASAAADFAANKTIGGLDIRGLVRATNDAEGGTAAGRLAATIGQILGEQSHTLTVGELPPHAHGVTIGQNPTPAYARVTGGDGINVSEISTNNGYGLQGLAHNNVQPTRAVTSIIKL